MDFRTKAWFEAADNLRESQTLDNTDPTYWALLLCALGNATMAALPDSVAESVEAEMARRRQVEKAVQKRVGKRIRDDLRGK